MSKTLQEGKEEGQKPERRRERLILESMGAVTRKVEDVRPCDKLITIPVKRYIAKESVLLCKGTVNTKRIFIQNDVVEALCPCSILGGKVFIIVQKAATQQSRLYCRDPDEIMQALYPIEDTTRTFVTKKKGFTKIDSVSCYCVEAVPKYELWIEEGLAMITDPPVPLEQATKDTAASVLQPPQLPSLSLITSTADVAAPAASSAPQPVNVPPVAQHESPRMCSSSKNMGKVKRLSGDEVQAFVSQSMPWYCVPIMDKIPLPLGELLKCPPLPTVTNLSKPPASSTDGRGGSGNVVNSNHENSGCGGDNDSNNNNNNSGEHLVKNISSSSSDSELDP